MTGRSFTVRLRRRAQRALAPDLVREIDELRAALTSLAERVDQLAAPREGQWPDDLARGQLENLAQSVPVALRMLRREMLDGAPSEPEQPAR